MVFKYKYIMLKNCINQNLNKFIIEKKFKHVDTYIESLCI